MHRERFLVGIDCCDLHTLLDTLLLMIGNGLGTIPLYILEMGAEPTPKLGEPDSKNEVQDILGCWTRCEKINWPSVGFVWSWLCEKKSLKALVCY